MQILENPITIGELKTLAEETFGDMIKAVVDVNLALIAVDAELHSDLEALLLENGSKQNDLWGVNFYPALGGDDLIEFDSMINIRPSQGNTSRGVDNKETQGKIRKITKKWIVP